MNFKPGDIVWANRDPLPRWPSRVILILFRLFPEKGKPIFMMLIFSLIILIMNWNKNA